MSPRSLVDDRRGAVMITGLFMGFLLIGCTWFVFGIAKALVFRARVQEAADAAAFSAAAIHAKGMNLIAAINLLFFVVTAVWLVMRVVEHTLFHVQTKIIGNDTIAGNRFSKGTCKVSIIGADKACAIADPLQELRKVNSEARKTVGDVMGATFPALSGVQDATARLAPAAGVATSLGLGAKFGHFTIALSPAMIPGEDLVHALGGEEDNGRPLGLPVTARTFGSLCQRGTRLTLERVVEALGNGPLGAVLDNGVVNTAVGAFVNATSGWVANEFCSGDDWAGHKRSETAIFEDRGPKVMHPLARNGADMMQVWAFTRGELTDRDEHNVAIASRNYRVGPSTLGQWYVAQAELFFDCRGGWGDGACNGDDNAMYNMRWRARLVRVHAPNVGGAFVQAMRSALLDGPVKNALREFVGLGGDSPPATFGERFEEELADGLFGEAFGLLRGEVVEGTGGDFGSTNGSARGIYH